MIFVTEDGSSMTQVSFVFYGFRFNVNKEGCAYDHDTYLINGEGLRNLYNCDIFPINSLTGEWGVCLKDCVSVHCDGYYVSKKLKIREVTETDLDNMRKFAEFIGVEYLEPAWRHCLATLIMTQEDLSHAKEELKRIFDELKKKHDEENSE